MSDKKVTLPKPSNSWQHLLDLKKQHQSVAKFGAPKKSQAVPRFIAKSRAGSR